MQTQLKHGACKHVIAVMQARNYGRPLEYLATIWCRDTWWYGVWYLSVRVPKENRCTNTVDKNENEKFEKSYYYCAGVPA